jgi:hypothetical protein
MKTNWDWNGLIAINSYWNEAARLRLFGINGGLARQAEYEGGGTGIFHIPFSIIYHYALSRSINSYWVNQTDYWCGSSARYPLFTH